MSLERAINICDSLVDVAQDCGRAMSSMSDKADKVLEGIKYANLCRVYAHNIVSELSKEDIDGWRH